MKSPAGRPDASPLAVIVPTLDEEDNVRRSLPELVATVDEVVVSDGGSGDATVQVARAAGARVVVGDAGRGPQLNRGAAATSAPLLCFLHADTSLPLGAAEAMRAAVAAGSAGGGFLVRFDSDRLSMRVGAGLVNLRTRLTRMPLGDQAQFVTRETFERLGGFADWPILEDLDFARRLRRVTVPALIPTPVTTSARRFLRRGPLRNVAGNWLIWVLFFGGVSPHRLAALYRHVR